eukprot:TRINITY_DN47641_c0_g1_i1.p1 TRINITY_DN47641_c0_g1~~TRINITY_DN47641_c0_g1_i1.p1  ORF type:complete len:365 (+),score=44.52 TRINITY_DN47641_c0_g1_i1:77-1171(+)
MAFLILFSITLAITEARRKTLGPAKSSNCTPRPPLPGRGECVGSPASQQLFEELLSLDYPFGFALLVAEADCHIDLRLLLLDNSGSTKAEDGQRYGSKISEPLERGVTRWEEIKDFALRQAKEQVSDVVFGVLNPSSFAYVQKPSVGTASFHMLEIAMQIPSPHGSTPLDKFVHDATHEMQTDPDFMKKKHPIFIIATDGEANDRNKFVEELRQLIRTSRHWRIVVRLTQGSESLIDFYNNLDKEIGAPMDVLDDYKAEAQEIHKLNDFFAYTPHMHFARSRGTDLVMFDEVDEKVLSAQQAVHLCEYLVKRDKGDRALTRDIHETFVSEIESLIEKVDKVYDPIKEELVPPVDVAKLKAFLKL